MQTPKTLDVKTTAQQSDELLITDTNGKTERITVENFHKSAPDATANHRGYVTTDAQAFAGKKTFNSGIKTDAIDTEEGLTIDGNTSVTGTLSASGNASIGGNETVTGKITAGAGVDVTGDVTATGKGTFGDDTSVTGDLDVSGDATVGGDLNIIGNIYQQGSSYETHAEKLYTKNDMVMLRDGAQSPLGSGELAGVTAKHYDEDGHDGVLAFDKTGTARVGDKGTMIAYVYSSNGTDFYTDAELTTAATIPAGVIPAATGETNQYSYTVEVDNTQPLLTRNEATQMVNDRVIKWNNTEKRAETTSFTDTEVATALVNLPTKQPKTLSTPITVQSVEQTTVEQALSALNSAIDTLVNTGINASLWGGVVAPKDRWLRFVSGAKKSLKIIKDTSIKVGSKTFYAENDAVFDLTSSITQNGVVYHVYLNVAEVDGEDVWTLSANTTHVADTSTSRWIGRFISLCAAVPAGQTGELPTENLAVGDTINVSSYNESEDPDFAAFYTKSVISCTADGSVYKTVVSHPLAGFSAGDILPESIWCITFKPDNKVEDCVCYNPMTGRADDVFFQSGTGLGTRSLYGQNPTVNRTQWGHQGDMLAVGKRLLKDWEFTAVSMGTPQRVSIGGSGPGTNGGKSISGARLISFWGHEDTAGVLWQWLEEYVGNTSTSDWESHDGSNGAFGKQYWNVYALLAGGYWDNGALCGSRCRSATHVRSAVNAAIGGRGSSRVKRGL